MPTSCLEVNCAMNRASIVISFVLASTFIASVQVYGQEDNNNESAQSTIVETHNQWGIMSDISYLGSISIGLGLSLGKTRTASGHFFGYNTGAIISYCFGNTILAVRPFFHLFGGSAGVMLGTSMPLLFNARTITIGIAPEFGVSIFGIASIYYRYNFYLMREYSSHEVGFTLLYNMRSKSN